MRALKAHVRGGRLVLDEPTDLPEGTEVGLTIVEDAEFTARAPPRRNLSTRMRQRAAEITDAPPLSVKSAAAC